MRYIFVACAGLDSQKRFMLLPSKDYGVSGAEMGSFNSGKGGKFAAFRRLILFNIAAVIGFILGTIAFTVSIFFYPDPTVAWLTGNVVGGLSHFAANYELQGQTKNEFAKCFVVFNATGIVSFLLASAMFATSVIFVGDSTASWFMGSVVGTLSHFVMNDKAIKIEFKLRRKTCELPPAKT